MDSNEELRDKLKALPRTSKTDFRYPIDAYEDDLVELIEAAVREARLDTEEMTLRYAIQVLQDTNAGFAEENLERQLEKNLYKQEQQKKG